MNYRLGLDIFYIPLKCIGMYWGQVSPQIQLGVQSSCFLWDEKYMTDCHFVQDEPPVNSCRGEL